MEYCGNANVMRGNDQEKSLHKRREVLSWDILSISKTGNSLMKSIFLGLCVLALVFVSASVIHAQQPIVNLVQWTVEQGGNGHWYGVIATKRPWVSQDSVARTLVQDGQTGYLATVTSAAENQFIVDYVIKDVQSDGILDEYYLGLHRTSGVFRWITGEFSLFTNWDSGEPNGDGTAACMWGWDYAARQDPDLRRLGKWNDVPDDTLYAGNIHQLWAIVEWGETNVNPSNDTLINLIQWPMSTGGNDHWYALVGLPLSWSAHDSLSRTLIQDSLTGYLATIGSSSENQFIVNSVIRGIVPSTSVDQYFVGGHNMGNAFRWITGEWMIFTNWYTGEPNGTGPAMAIRGASLSSPGRWVDAVSEPSSSQSSNRLWAVIEWGPLDSIPEPEEALINVKHWREADGGNHHWYGVIARKRPWANQNAIAQVTELNGRPGHLATIANTKENQFIVDSIIRGVHSDGILDEYYLGFLKTAGQFRWITGEPVTFSNWDAGEPNGDGNATCMWGWEYAKKVDENARRLGKWNDVPQDTVYVGSIHQLWAIIEWDAPPLVCGDANDDGVTAFDDLTYLIAYYFGYGPTPPRPSAADLNNNGLLELGDLSALAALLEDRPTEICEPGGSTEHPKGDRKDTTQDQGPFDQ